MHNQLLRGLIFIILVFLVTSDLKEIISTLATSPSFGAFLQKPKSAAGRSSSQNSAQQRSRRHTAPTSLGQNSLHDDADNEYKNTPSWDAIKRKDEGGQGKNSPSENSDYESLDEVKRLRIKGQNIKKKFMKLNDEEKKELLAMKTQLTAVMQEWCLPKLVCELHASVADRGSLTEAEKGLLNLIRETSLGTMGEVVSRYHFAAHMGQLLSGVEGNGCHNFYPSCPLSGSRVLQMMKKVRIR